MTTWVGTGWKMNKTLVQARDYAEILAATVLARFGAVLGPSLHILVGAQNAHGVGDGVWTGEESVVTAPSDRVRP